jgi:glycosyltransferase involved in cell wall biosynthesis
MNFKISFIITGLSTGGAETMLFKLLESLDRSRFTPTVISLATQGEIGPRIESLGIPVHALGMMPGTPSPIKFMRLVRLLRDSRPDVVHTWMYHADLLGGLAARMAGIKQIVWGIRHSNLSKNANKRSTLAVVRLCALLSRWLPAYIFSCSIRAKDIHIAIGYAADKLAVIPNGFDLQRFTPNPYARLDMRQELKLQAETLLIGLIGRFDPQKNHLGFVEAARLLRQRQPDVHFILAGTGIDQNNRVLCSAIEKADLSQHFHLLGRRDDVPRLMAALDLLASSSDGEAFPNVLGESMACEVPCVVTDVGDSADIVGDTGRVVAAGDMVALANNLLELLSLAYPERQRLGHAARQRVANCYEIGHVVRQYQDFYLTMSKATL